MWLQVDRLLPLEVAQKLSILLLPATLLLVGAYIVLFFVVRSYDIQSKRLAEAEETLKEKAKYGVIPASQRPEIINYPPSGIV